VGQIKDNSYIQSYTVRRLLTESAVALDCDLGLFVGAEAYEAAGGTITRDLFSGDDDGFMDDAALVRRLAIEKLEAKAAELRPQWAWTKAVLDPEYGFMAQYRRVHPQPAEVGRPFHDGCRDRHQRRVQQRLGQPMSLLMLPGGNDQRRARIERREQRAHRIAEPRRDMHIARDQLTRGTGIPIRHGDNDRLLQAEHVAHVRIIGERMHDRQLGGSRIAEKVGDALG
jgi:hypothetical protein